MNIIIEGAEELKMTSNSEAQVVMIESQKSGLFCFELSNGRWKDILSPDELTLYDLACDKVLSPDCRDWLENGGDIS